jgi:glycosyltransferase involved in cell wall biosynthesis
MRIKVLFLPTWYPWPGNQVRGIFVQEHAKAAQLFDDVAVLCGKPASITDRCVRTQMSEEEGLPTFRFTYPELPVPCTFWLSYAWGVQRAFRKVLRRWGRPDVIHAQEPHSAIAGSLLHYLYNIPYLVSEHCSAFGLHTLNWSWKMLARLSYPRARRVLGVNRNFPRDFAYYSFTCNFRWLPNSIDTEVFYPPTLPERQPIVLHCSMFRELKRVPDLVRAFALVQEEFPQARLELVGDGEKRPLTEQLAQELLRPDSYIFHGVLSKPRLAELMRRAAVLVLPSQFETQSCVLLEAMACGTPVVATPVGDIPYFVGTDQGILIDPGDIPALAAAIKAILGGTRTFDPALLAASVARTFSKVTVGRLLHEEHALAAGLRP